MMLLARAPLAVITDMLRPRAERGVAIAIRFFHFNIVSDARHETDGQE